MMAMRYTGGVCFEFCRAYGFKEQLDLSSGLFTTPEVRVQVTIPAEYELSFEDSTETETQCVTTVVDGKNMPVWCSGADNKVVVRFHGEGSGRQVQSIVYPQYYPY
jgi:hypothetical protein